ncbi:hypothetical protein ACL07V_34515 [Streptomyces sp. MB22_4]|uniref:hypothetical protein n=1 Tax=Streptomyces sp. MB22_4 TaxID=3383120 RepID=UPI0039A32D44
MGGAHAPQAAHQQLLIQGHSADRIPRQKAKQVRVEGQRLGSLLTLAQRLDERGGELSGCGAVRAG